MIYIKKPRGKWRKRQGTFLCPALSVSLNEHALSCCESERERGAAGGGFFDESTNADDYDDAASQEDKREEQEKEEKRQWFPLASSCWYFVLINAKRVSNKSQTIKITRGIKSQKWKNSLTPDRVNLRQKILDLLNE